MKDDSRAVALQECIARLTAVNARRGSSFVRDFEATLAEIAAMNDAESIVPLLDFLEDEPPSGEQCGRYRSEAT